MNDTDNKAERKRKAVAMDIWENEGRAPGPALTDPENGCGKPFDRVRQAHHVVMDVPARAHGSTRIGLSRSSVILGANFSRPSMKHHNAKIPTGGWTGLSETVAWQG